jgi:hypothetical protein
MTGFFKTERGNLIPLGSIRRIGAPFEQTTGRGIKIVVQRIHYADGETFDAFESDVDKLAMRPDRLLPAEPGTKLIAVGVHESRAWIRRAPLIAWAFCLDGEMRPVTPDGVNDGTTPPDLGWWVEMPDGKLYAACGSWDLSQADSEQELLDWASDNSGTTKAEVTQ